MNSSLKGAMLENRNFDHFNDSPQWTGRTWKEETTEGTELSPISQKKEISPESSHISIRSWICRL